jgi:DNA-binding transcriptional MocR family regulator
MQLAIPISRKGDPLFRQVYSGVRQAILSGALRPGERLPSTRDLAEQLGLSRTVVLLAYDHLLGRDSLPDKRVQAPSSPPGCHATWLRAPAASRACSYHASEKL